MKMGDGGRPCDVGKIERWAYLVPNFHFLESVASKSLKVRTLNETLLDLARTFNKHYLSLESICSYERAQTRMIYKACLLSHVVTTIRGPIGFGIGTLDFS